MGQVHYFTKCDIDVTAASHCTERPLQIEGRASIICSWSNKVRSGAHSKSNQGERYDEYIDYLGSSSLDKTGRGSFVALSRAGHYQKTKGGLVRVR